jgi:putative ABC transport system permease protein
MSRWAGKTLPADVEQTIRRVLEAADLPSFDRGDVEDDLRNHFEDGLTAGRSAAELVERFGDPEEAGRRIALARRRRLSKQTHGNNGRWWMSARELWNETKLAARTLMRAPAFSLLVVVTLALGVGANTAVFTALDAVLLAPLPYDAPERLVRINEDYLDDEEPGQEFLRAAAILEYRQWDEVFESVGVLNTYRELGGDLTDGDQPERVIVSHADAGLFESLGVGPLMGRVFREDESIFPGESEDRAPGAPVAVLSHGLWEGRFAADPGVVGRTVQLDGSTFEIVGVMPQGFTNPFGSPPDLWVPQDLRMGGYNSWGNHYLSAIARLRDGVTIELAQERVDALVAGLIESNGDAAGWGVVLRPLRDDVVGEGRRTMLWVLAVAVGLVLLSACVNVGNLVFARSLGRGRDLAVRGALGSGRLRLIAHLLTESAILAVVGGIAGVAVGWLGIRGILRLAPDALPALVTPELSMRVFLVAMAATTVALALFGLVPALRFSLVSPVDALRAGGRGGTESRKLRGVRNLLVVTQVAVALVLLVGAGLLVRSFAEVQRVDLGFDAESVLTFEVHLPDARYPDGAGRHAFHETLQDRIGTLPGVESVGATSWLPVSGRYHSWGVSPDVGALDESERFESVDMRFFVGDYFETMGISMVQGDAPTEVDAEGALPVWVNQRYAEATFPDGDAVGSPLFAANEDRRIAGVVDDVAYEPHGAMSYKVYVPHSNYADNRNWALIQTVRARGDLGTLRDRIREELRAVDPQLVMFRPRPMQSLLASAQAQDRFAASLMGIFAVLALVLSAVGTYGVLSSAVARRRREIGIRIALGADAGRVRGMVLGSAVAMTTGGALLGALGAWAGSRWLQSLLFEVSAADPGVMVTSVLLLVALGALSAWIPARRATGVDPATALASD